MVLLVEIRVIPVGTTSPSLSKYVAEILKILENNKIKYVLAPSGTCIEIEDFNKLAEILDNISKHMKNLQVDRILIDLTIDLRFDKKISLEYEVASVKEKLSKYE